MSFAGIDEHALPTAGHVPRESERRPPHQATLRVLDVRHQLHRRARVRSATYSLVQPLRHILPGLPPSRRPAATYCPGCRQPARPTPSTHPRRTLRRSTRGPTVRAAPALPSASAAALQCHQRQPPPPSPPPPSHATFASQVCAAPALPDLHFAFQVCAAPALPEAHGERGARGGAPAAARPEGLRRRPRLGALRGVLRTLALTLT